VTEPTTPQPRETDLAVARAVCDLSTAVLNLGFVLAGAHAMAAALDEEAEGSPAARALADVDDPPGSGVDEDGRRPPDDADVWVCPDGATDEQCRLTHDHYPPPIRDRRRRG
jgi:hypothetical protein